MKYCAGCGKHIKEGGQAIDDELYCWVCIGDTGIEVVDWMLPTRWQAKSKEVHCQRTLRFEVLYRFKGKCCICKVPEWKLRAKLQMHRVIPNHRGGRYVLSNIVPVCVRCHKVVEGKTREEIDALYGTIAPYKYKPRIR